MNLERMRDCTKHLTILIFTGAEGTEGCAHGIRTAKKIVSSALFAIRRRVPDYAFPYLQTRTELAEFARSI
jgi:hypothetical protein